MNKLRLTNVRSGDLSELEVDGLFVAIGIHPSTELFKEYIACDDNGYIIANETGKTSAPGIFVAGDARTKRLRQIITAVADGANAATSVQDYLVSK